MLNLTPRQSRESELMELRSTNAKSDVVTAATEGVVNMATSKEGATKNNGRIAEGDGRRVPQALEANGEVAWRWAV